MLVALLPLESLVPLSPVPAAPAISTTTVPPWALEERCVVGVGRVEPVVGEGIAAVAEGLVVPVAAALAEG